MLANPASYAGRTLRPTGPKVLSPDEIAAAVGNALGREIRYLEASEAMFVKPMNALGLADPFVLSQAVHYLREYRRGTFELGYTTDVVMEVTGQPAEDFETIARRYAAADSSTQRSLPNLLRALGQMAKVVASRPLNLERWQREHAIPIIKGEDCADAEDWKRTHSPTNAFGMVPHAPATPQQVSA